MQVAPTLVILALVGIILVPNEEHINLGEGVTVTSPDTVALLQAIDAVTDNNGAVYPEDLHRSIRQAIYMYSPEADVLCHGKSPEFCQGVLLTLELHKLGKLKGDGSCP